MVKVGEVMITTFQTESVQRVMASNPGEIELAETEYLVVTAEDQQPLSLLPAGQVGILPREGGEIRLSVVPVVSEETEWDEAVRRLAPQLLDRSDLAGAIVLLNGEIRGVLPRSLIAHQAGNLLNALGYGLPGAPLSPPPTYSCPRGDYQEELSYYDPFHPPLCPNHGERLVRTA